MRVLNVFLSAALWGSAAAILFLFVHVEWRFIHGNLANALNPLVQLFVLGSMLILPLFWLLLAAAVVCCLARRSIRKRISSPAMPD
jgi:hypothetical protein